MSTNRDLAALLDIYQAAKKVLRYKEGLNKAEFLDDDKTQSAIVFQLLISGEAVKRLTPEFRNQHPEIPWSLIAGMRDKLIHNYDDVDLEEVWKTATSDVPTLIAQLMPLLS
jgi:uncharacterized protein with HEPN domain